MIVEGKKIAEEILFDLEAARKKLKPVIKLGILMGGGTPATASFVGIKEKVANRLRVVVVKEVVPPKASTREALQSLRRLSGNTDAVIVQLPLPEGIDVDAILAEIPPKRDVDCMRKDTRFIQSPVAEAISEILVRAHVSARGKKAVVVGAGRLVGEPAAELLRSLKAQVSVITEEEGALEELYEADIIVSGAGQPGLIGPHMIKKGVVLIDAGTSEMGGRVVGDADPRCGEAASVFTPTPGGLGPIVVAMLFKNLLELVLRSEL